MVKKNYVLLGFVAIIGMIFLISFQSSTVHALGNSNAKMVTVTLDTFSEGEIELESGVMEIVVSDVDKPTLEYNSKTISYSQEGSELKVKENRNSISINTTYDAKLSLPKDMMLNELDIDVDDGSIKMSDVVASQADVDLKSGFINGESCQFNRFDLDVKSGVYTSKDGQVGNAEIEVKSGSVSLDKTKLHGDISIEIGSGTGKVDLDKSQKDKVQVTVANSSTSMVNVSDDLKTNVSNPEASLYLSSESGIISVK
jgi:hypothetical protein